MSVPTGAPDLRRLIDAIGAYALPAWRSRRYSMAFQPGEWLEGLILAESAGNPRARRYEPLQDRATRRDAAMDPDTADTDDGLLEDDASYGLMQVMGTNIRRLCGGIPLVAFPEFNCVAAAGPGAADDETFLAPMSFAFAFLPATNLTLGVRVLRAELEAVGGDVERALARYNGGPTGDDVKPEYGNDMRLRKYVDRVVAHAQAAVADRALSGWKVQQ